MVGSYWGNQRAWTWQKHKKALHQMEKVGREFRWMTLGLFACRLDRKVFFSSVTFFSKYFTDSCVCPNYCVCFQYLVVYRTICYTRWKQQCRGKCFLIAHVSYVLTLKTLQNGGEIWDIYNITIIFGATMCWVHVLKLLQTDDKWQENYINTRPYLFYLLY